MSRGELEKLKTALIYQDFIFLSFKMFRTTFE